MTSMLLFNFLLLFCYHIALGSLLAFARAEACRREQVNVNPPIRALVFVAELSVFVAVYEVPNKVDADEAKQKVG
jgi:hypothetical protein